MPLNNIDFNHIVVDEISSTSKYLKDNFKSLNNNTFISTNYQSMGHGQFNRVWESNKSENILLSWLIKDSSFNAYQVKTHVTKVLIKVLNKHQINASFKYPNDLYVNDKKLAGILIETKGNKDEYDYIIVGVGLNVNQKTFIEPNAISMNNINNKTYDVKKIINEIISGLIKISNYKVI